MPVVRRGAYTAWSAAEWTLSVKLNLSRPFVGHSQTHSSCASSMCDAAAAGVLHRASVVTRLVMAARRCSCHIRSRSGLAYFVAPYRLRVLLELCVRGSSATLNLAAAFDGSPLGETAIKKKRKKKVSESKFYKDV